jgi:hypothetical protein
VRQDLVVRLPHTVAGYRRGWSVAQFLVAQARRLKIVDIRFAGKHWSAGDRSSNGWVRGATGTRTRIDVSIG